MFDPSFGGGGYEAILSELILPTGIPKLVEIIDQTGEVKFPLFVNNYLKKAVSLFRSNTPCIFPSSGAIKNQIIDANWDFVNYLAFIHLSLVEQLIFSRDPRFFNEVSSLEKFISTRHSTDEYFAGHLHERALRHSVRKYVEYCTSPVDRHLISPRKTD